MDAPHARWSLLASFMLPWMSCTPPAVKDAGNRGTAGGESAAQCPLFERDPMKEPDLMAWDPTQRQKINEKRDEALSQCTWRCTGAT